MILIPSVLKENHYWSQMIKHQMQYRFSGTNLRGFYVFVRRSLCQMDDLILQERVVGLSICSPAFSLCFIIKVVIGIFDVMVASKELSGRVCKIFQQYFQEKRENSLKKPK